MMSTIVAGVIAGVCAIISAVLTALIDKKGVAFWRSGTVVPCRGTGQELGALHVDGSLARCDRDCDYTLSNVKVTVRGKQVTVCGLLNMTNDKVVIRDASIKGQGVFRNGVGFVVYSVTDGNGGQAWDGVLLLRIPGIGDLTGYWMADDHIEPGVIEFGTVSLERA